MTFLAIILIIIYVVCASKKDKRSKKEEAQVRDAREQLPDMCYTVHEVTSAQKALNLWPSDNDILALFKYDSTSKIITLKMKDGRQVSTYLSNLFIDFANMKGVYRIVVQHGKTTFSFYKYPYYFTEKEWEVILSTLTLAGSTRNAEIMGSAYKNMSRAMTVAKIIKAIS